MDWADIKGMLLLIVMLGFVFVSGIGLGKPTHKDFCEEYLDNSHQVALCVSVRKQGAKMKDIINHPAIKQLAEE